MAELGSLSRALLPPSVKAPWYIFVSKLTTRYVPRSKLDSAENVYKAQLKVDTRQLAPTAIYLGASLHTNYVLRILTQDI